jgi:hypothetical protein
VGITVDFQRILGFASYHPSFKDFVLDLSGFETKLINEAMTVMKAIPLSGLIERRQIETEIENLLNLRHPMIATLIGCVLPVKSSGPREFRESKTVRLYVTEASLADVLLNPPAWWTPPVKAKAVVGIALGLRARMALDCCMGR